ncbi:hypothetical protein [Brevundimonas faecalis]|uniref:Uncharacterized protein n=1 Tax=Brevundimonas faecalis TaxID=947378 RepID=A0ABV2R9U0_9CAUL
MMTFVVPLRDRFRDSMAEQANAAPREGFAGFRPVEILQNPGAAGFQG